MCKLCDEGNKTINVVYLDHTTEASTKVIIPICQEKVEQFKADIYKLRKKYCGPTKAKGSTEHGIG
jgi:hypothetical protein